MNGEFALIDWIRKNTPLDSGKFPIGIGDDAAAVRLGSGELALLTTDMIVEGTHFQLPCSPYRIGWKAICCGLSDVAAMGVRATAAVVSLALPARPGREDLDMAFAKRIYRGMAKVSREFGVAIVGGDVVSWDGPIAVAVTVLGETGGLRPVRRNGARGGDWLMVTGTLGGSGLGKHLRFRPRLKEGYILNEGYSLHSMIDISDGLLGDLGHILAESGVGAVLFAAKIPISRAARRLSSKSGKNALHHALYDGEDFELLFSASPRESRKILNSQKPLGKLLLSHIGEVRKKKGLFILYPDGQECQVEPIGYEHFRHVPRRTSHVARRGSWVVGRESSLSFTSHSVGETLNLGQRLGEALRPGATVALIGPLGAGKTIFVKGLARGLGIEPVVASPTFILINEYQGRLPFYHIDAYRLRSAEELLALGADEFFYGEGVTAVEWADHIEEALPKERLNVGFSIMSRNKRNILITPRGKAYEQLLKDLAAELTPHS